MHIGPWHFANPVFVAPMAGVTDRPYRRLCKALGASYAVCEMAASNPQLWHSVKTAQRTDHTGEPDPVAVQIAGADPAMMAEAALFNIRKGARIIDINMGCPVKKVCHNAAGSALMRQPELVARILDEVVRVCLPQQVPVTLKIRTGWDRNRRNALEIARLAESIGVAAVTVHGRTRCDFYQGQAEYDTIRTLKQNLAIPVIANGDIDSPAKARQVLDYTGADALMVGRAAQGRPWIFAQINHFLATGKHLPLPTYGQLHAHLLGHLQDHYSFYGEHSGVRSARKHIAWYLRDLPGSTALLSRIMPIESSALQSRALDAWFSRQDPHTHIPSPTLH